MNGKNATTVSLSAVQKNGPLIPYPMLHPNGGERKRAKALHASCSIKPLYCGLFGMSLCLSITIKQNVIFE